MGENVRVVVRCRPINKRERHIGCKEIINIEDCAVVIQNPSDPLAPAKTFTYDNAYDANAPTEALYNDICYALVENVLEGYNGTIFAYGQTGCGKSHTMQGPDNVDVISTQRGIISRSFDHIFEAISVASGVQFLALVSYLEIYNENIRDLLASNDGVNANHALKEIPGEGVTVPSLSTHTVHNARECDDLLRIGGKNRMVGATLMNAGSSRSHSIFTISLEQIETNPMPGKRAPGIRKGKLNLVDLAGSERQNKTGAAGDRLKEATKINLSLSALGNVISALVDGKTKHIPYRDSKLTRMLQDSLGGNTKTLMIACVSPADYNYDETLSTLRYASRAKNISNKPKINEDPKDAMLREYQEEILKLKKMLESSQTVPMEDNTHWLEVEKAKLQQEYNLETNRLKEEHAVQQKEKEELVRDMERLKTHYDNQLKALSTVETNNNRLGVTNLNEASTHHAFGVTTKETQLEVQNRIEMIKNALIGGERANDVQLREKRHKKKLAAQGRLSALAHALSRVEQSEDRNLLQVHYSSIQQELKVKNESLKTYRQKIRALEREVSDLQSEFQLDRADYLETIRRLERNMKFYAQILEMALPILRKDGKYWDPDEIMRASSWNDDLKNWKLPEDSMNSFKLPLAVAPPPPTLLSSSSSTPALSSLSKRSTTTFTPFPQANKKRHPPPLMEQPTTATGSFKVQQQMFRLLPMDQVRYHKQTKSHNMDGFLVQEHVLSASAPSAQTQRLVLDNDVYDATEEEQNFDNPIDNDEIVSNYFRPRRNIELVHQRKGFNNWKDFTIRNRRVQQPQFPHNISATTTTTPPVTTTTIHMHPGSQQRHINSSWMSLSSAASSTNNNRVLSSWLPQNHRSMSKTWCGLTGQQLPLASSPRLESPLRDAPPIDNPGKDFSYHLHPPLAMQQNQAQNYIRFPRNLASSNSEDREYTTKDYLLPRIGPLSETRLIVLPQQQRRPRRVSALKIQRQI